MNLSLRISACRDLTPEIRQLQLVDGSGAPLPAFSPGAHIQVAVQLVDGAIDWRHYSLVELDSPAGLRAPESYTIAVRRDDGGRGGSRHMHRLQVGDTVTVQPPKNDFPLFTGSGRAVLIAGGIGITPLATMAMQCRVQGHPVQLHYAGRSRATMAFLPQLEKLLGSDLYIHEDSVAGAPLDVDMLLAGCDKSDQLHVCGPKALLDRVLEKTRENQWPRDQVHFELFSAPAQTGDGAFELVLAQSGRTLEVSERQSVLDCLVDAGCDPVYDCKRGECGVCSTPVLEGEIDHRDYFLSDAEKASGSVMQICVSRARGRRLVLDI